MYLSLQKAAQKVKVAEEAERFEVLTQKDHSANVNTNTLNDLKETEAMDKICNN